MSVFSSPPPNYSVEDVMLLIKVHYGIKVQAMILNSERDQNFLCNAGEKKYVLKISNPDEDRFVLEMQNACMQYIKEHDPSLQVPLAFKEVKTIKNEGTSFFIRLVDYLPGQLLMEMVHHSDLLYELGSFLGRLRIAMNGFDHPAGHRDFPWDVAYIDFIKEHKHYLESKESVVDHFIDQYEQIVLPITSKLRKALIHNDGNDHNVLVNKNGKTTGIIDFGDMIYSYVALEPAVCMAYVALDKDNPLNAIAQVLKGFHQSFPLNENELKSVIYLMCLRLCISITMVSYRQSLFPENTYLSVSESPAREFLNRMKSENLALWSDKLIGCVNA